MRILIIAIAILFTPDYGTDTVALPESKPFNACGETAESNDGLITINLAVCLPDPERGVISWKGIAPKS